jgi:hypothetical protein
MGTINDGPKPGNTPKQSNQSSAVVAAIIDNEWFDANPDTKMYTRDVIAGEVPSSLRSKSVRKVRATRISGGVILYEFADRSGDAVGHSLYFPDGFLSTEEGRAQASVCLKLVKSLASLGSEDE